MLRSLPKWPAVLLPALLLVLANRAGAADAPLAGKWLLKDVSNGNNVLLALIEIEQKDGKATAKTLSAPLLGDKLVLSDVKTDAKSVRFTFKVRGNTAWVVVFAPKGEEKPKVLRGSLQLMSLVLFTELERTDLKEINEEEAQKKTPAGQQLTAALRERDAKEKEKKLKEVIEKHGDSAAGYAAAEMLLTLKIKEGVKDDELKPIIQQMEKSSAPFGPVMVKRAQLTAAQSLVKAEKVSPLAVEYAAKAEKSLTKEDAAENTAMVLRTLEIALRKTGKTDEAKVVAGRLAKIDDQLDAEFIKTAIPFEPDAFKGRKAKSSRIAVVELFTGAWCPPCVAADVAFDAVLKTYKPADVVMLQYHLHIPRPDPLTNADSEKRQKYYGGAIRGTPTAFVNGKTTPEDPDDGLGGGKADAKESYDKLRQTIDKALEKDDEAKLKLTVDRKGDKIEAKAEVEDLKKTGDKVHLRFVLVQDVVRYVGGNGQRLHHHVVRALPGGAEGFPLKEAKAEQAVTIIPSDLKKELTDYLETAEKRRPFQDDARPVDLKHLKLIALIQDDETKEILQAVQVDVPEGK